MFGKRRGCDAGCPHLGTALDTACAAVGVLNVNAVLIDVDDDRAELHFDPDPLQLLLGGLCREVFSEV